MDQPGQRSGTVVATQLSVMMFLQFFIWGAWYVTMGPFMDAAGMGAKSIAWAYTVGPIAAIASPFFLGMVADRFFATERVTAVMHLLGGVFLCAAPIAAQQSEVLFVVAILLHMLCYMPTLGLTSSLALHNMTNAEKQFPLIRVFGTIGWIVAKLGDLAARFRHVTEYVLRRRRMRPAPRRLQLRPAAHPRARQRQALLRPRRPRPRLAGDAQEPILRGVLCLLVPAMHPARGVLRLRGPIRR